MSKCPIPKFSKIALDKKCLLENIREHFTISFLFLTWSGCRDKDFQQEGQE